MSVLDAYGEISKDLEAKYDLIQLRLFQVVVKNNDPGPLLRNVMKMLSKLIPFCLSFLSVFQAKKSALR